MPGDALNQAPMKTNPTKEPLPGKSVFIEIAVYGVLVFIYAALVLNFLGDKVKQLYDNDKQLYAVAALTLMISQGLGLDWLTSWLLRVAIRRSK